MRAIYFSVRKRAFSRKQTVGQKMRLVAATLTTLCFVSLLSGLAEACVLSLGAFLVLRWIHLKVFDLEGGVVFAFAALYSLTLALVGRGYAFLYSNLLRRIRRIEFFPAFPYNDQTFTKSLTGKEIHSRDNFWGPRMPRVTILSPNLLTVARALGAVFLAFFHGTSAAVFLPIVIALALTDFFDGIIARTQGRKSTFGEWADPIADRILLLAVAIFLYSKNPDFWSSAAARIAAPEATFLLVGLAIFLTKKPIIPRAVFWGRLKFVLYLISAGILLLGNVTLAWVCLNAGIFFSWISAFSYITRFYQENRNKSIFNGVLEWFINHSSRIREELSTCQ